MEWLGQNEWSPYIVGIGIGILSWLTFLLSDKYIGCSTTFARASGMIEGLFRGDKVKERPYFQKYAPIVDWGWMLVIGIVIGAFISARLSGYFHVRYVPDEISGELDKTIVTVPSARWIVAFIGGIFIGIGSRWANGCTSGHGISGTLQLAVSSWLAAISFFTGGIITAMLIFRLILA